MRYRDFSYIPTAVYRLQFSNEFTFKDAIAIIPYLKTLGIQAVYSSPYYDSNSNHGYDVADPNKINPEVGSAEDFENFCMTLKNHDMGQILDVVPNHMGIKGGKNKWWQDVLENGPLSQYSSFFDIEWSPDKRELRDKVLVCILANDFGHSLENQDIKLVIRDGYLQFQIYDFYLPISFQSYSIFLEEGWQDFKQRNNSAKKEMRNYEKVIEIFKNLPVNLAELQQKKEEGMWRFNYLYEDSPLLRKFIQKQIVLFNGKKGDPTSFNLLEKILEKQFYRLASWKVAAHEINYRRFFNINELAAIRIEQEQVFLAHHRLVFQLVAEKKIHGLRIDHPDGLYDPIHYFEKLRLHANVPIFVEKILERKETLPENWDIEGTVGYEYLNILNGIFIVQSHEEAFNDIYHNFIGQNIDFEELIYEKKKLFTRFLMASEINALGFKLDSITELNRYFKDFTRPDLTKAIQETIACFPVYRTYIASEGEVVSKRDVKYITIAIEKAKRKSPFIDASVFNFLKRLLLLKLKVKREEKEDYRDFILRFQQLSGPIMAKGLEDTCFYIYNRFISLNEVGGDPEHFGNSINEFHRFNQIKQKNWPLGFLATSTHDTKRGEDVRMRLNALSEMPEKWNSTIKKWALVNAKYKTEIDGVAYPSANIEYFIYQTLVGVWPIFLKAEEYELFFNRIWEVILKSIRESREETDWINPNLAYEEAVRNFLSSILQQPQQNLFLKVLFPFQKHINILGMFNSLSAIALKIASPGIVEIYQGSELWHYCLVDPDNRRNVNYEMRENYLKQLIKISKNKHVNIVSHLLRGKDFGKIKQYIYFKGLNFRIEHPGLFLDGDYIPLKVQGKFKHHIVAFLRKEDKKYLIVLAGRFFDKLMTKENHFPIGAQVWQDTHVLLPKELYHQKFTELFTDRTYQFKNTLNIGAIFDSLPLAYLILMED